MDKVFLDEVIWRYKNPSHRGKCEGIKCSVQNVSCGDDLFMFVSTHDGVIDDMKFDGEMCSICNYGAELLCERAIGIGVEEARELGSKELLGETGRSLLNNPVRLKCFELAQVALEELE